MISFIENPIIFEKYEKKFQQLFDPSRSFKMNLFREEFFRFLAFEFDFIYDKYFFHFLKKLIIHEGGRKLVFYTVKPSPEDFYIDFKVYNAFEIDISNSEEELNNVLMRSPCPHKTPIGLANSSDDLVWLSESNDWAIAASREWETAVIGFKDDSIKDFFCKLTEEEWPYLLNPIKDFIQDLGERFKFNERQYSIYEPLIEAYKDFAIK